MSNQLIEWFKSRDIVENLNNDEIMYMLIYTKLYNIRLMLYEVCRPSYLLYYSYVYYVYTHTNMVHVIILCNIYVYNNFLRIIKDVLKNHKTRKLNH